MENWSRVIVSFLVLCLGILYTLEMSPRQGDDIVELSSTQVIMITKCSTVFDYIGDLANYAEWFPGIDSISSLRPGLMENGKQFAETVTLPIYGDYSRVIYVTAYAPPHRLQFMYEDMSKVAVTLSLTQQTEDRCVMDYDVGTRRKSLLYHIFVGGPLRLMYSLRGRHALFAIRSMFNQKN